MARRLPQVLVPLETLFERDGVEIALVSVELWPEEVVVRLAGLPNEVTQRLEAEFESAFEGWGQRRRAGSDEPPPEAPPERIFDLDVELRDDTGTTYRLRSAARGGTGRLFRAEWFFRPGVPAEATMLSVRAAEARLELELE